ncbi:hypothetical protein MMC09_006433 [Bachmanniomyces sp. S44760]|nr:hypothetical protein [Bachmanniomyces sp. S44760]
MGLARIAYHDTQARSGAAFGTTKPKCGVELSLNHQVLLASSVVGGGKSHPTDLPNPKWVYTYDLAMSHGVGHLLDSCFEDIKGDKNDLLAELQTGTCADLYALSQAYHMGIPEGKIHESYNARIAA